MTHGFVLSHGRILCRLVYISGCFGLARLPLCAIAWPARVIGPFPPRVRAVRLHAVKFVECHVASAGRCSQRRYLTSNMLHKLQRRCLEVSHTTFSGMSHQPSGHVDQMIPQTFEPTPNQALGHRQLLKQRVQIVSQNHYAPPSRVHTKLVRR